MYYAIIGREEFCENTCFVTEAPSVSRAAAQFRRMVRGPYRRAKDVTVYVDTIVASETPITIVQDEWGRRVANRANEYARS